MLFFLVILLSIIIVDFILYYIYFRKNFAQAPLDIKTFDGSNQPYHPSVLFFEQGWNGYKYWMVETPYPINGKPYRDRWECPMIHVSNDGILWNQIEDVPIDDLTKEEIDSRDFFSDPHLVYTNDRIECFYRISHRLELGYRTLLLRKVSVDGRTWGKREIIADFEHPLVLATLGDMVRSHALVFQDGKYKMWYVDSRDPNGHKNVCYSSSIDGVQWDKKQVCQLSGKDISPWHIDLNIIDGKYILTIYDFHELSIWKGFNELDFEYVKTILVPSGVFGSFYSDGLYRSSLIYDNVGFKMFFSAFSEKSTYLGLLAGSDIEKMQLCDAGHLSLRLVDYFNIYFKNRKILLWCIKQRFKRLYYDKK